MNDMQFFMIMSILPLYIGIGMMAIFMFMNNKKQPNFTEEMLKILVRQQQQESEQIIIEKVEVTQNKVENVEEDMKEVKTQMKEVVADTKQLSEEVQEQKKTIINLDDYIEERITESLKIQAYLSQEQKDKLQERRLDDKLRHDLDLERIKREIDFILEPILLKYFDDTYYFNANILTLDGDRKLPEITETTKARDIQAIFESFKAIANNNLMYNDLGMLLKKDPLLIEAFILENYVLPAYSRELYTMIEEWQVKRAEAEARQAEEIARQQRLKEYQIKEDREADEKVLSVQFAIDKASGLTDEQLMEKYGRLDFEPFFG